MQNKTPKQLPPYKNRTSNAIKITKIFFCRRRILHKKSLHDKDCLLIDLKYGFKYIILSFLNELLSISYMNKKLEKSSFHLSLNHNKISYVASDINQIVYKYLI